MPTIGELLEQRTGSVEDLGFSVFHRRDVADGSDISANLSEEIVETNQVFPDLAFSDDKIETLSVQKLISGTIYSQQITLGVTATEGDVYIAGGTFDASAWTATGGFILGIDDSDSDKEKLYIGSATSSLDWNVTTADTLTLNGTAVIGGSVGGWTITTNYIYSLDSGTPTASPSDGVVLDSALNAIRIYEDTEVRTIMGYISAGVYGLKVYATDGSTVLFEASDTQNTAAGFTLGGTSFSVGSNIVLDSANKLIAINDSTFGNQGIQLDYNSGTPRFYAGNGSNYFFNFDGANISWGAVNTTLSTGGKLTTTSADIGGWNVVNGYIYNLQSGTPTATPSDGIVLASGNEALIVYEDTAKRAEVGYLSSGVYGIKVYDSGGSNVIFEASDTQQKVGGFYFTDTTLATNATTNDANVLIDAGNSLIRLGPTSVDYLTIDGANQKIESSNYVSGFLGAGFTLQPDLLEVGNISARGIFRASTFEYNSIQVHSGSQLVVMGGDKLDADMTALDSANVVIEGNDTFVNGDILYIKEGNDAEWLEVTDASGAPTYVVTRDKAGSYGADANPAWTTGACVANYGQSGDGGVYTTADDTNAPYIQIFTHAGSPWSATTTQARFGNLNGYLGYSSDLYGVGIGSSSGTDANITIEATNGIRMRSGTTSVYSVDNSGNVTVGEVGAGKANTYISAGALSIRLNTTALFGVDTSGNVLIGQTGAGQDNVYITSGAIYLRNNTTSLITLDTSGNILVGQASASENNVYISSGALQFRTNTTVNMEFDTSGNILVGQTGAGQNNVYISSGAIDLRSNTTSLINLDTSGNILVGQTGASQSNVYISAGQLEVRNNTTPVITLSAAGTLTVKGTIQATAGYLAGALTLGDGSTTNGTITFSHTDTAGDTYIAAGKTDFSTTTAGFILGIDDSDSDLAKFYLGDTTNYFYFDGAEAAGRGNIIPIISLTAGENIGAGECVRIHTDGKVYQGGASHVDFTSNTIGFAPSAITAASAGDIQLTNIFTTSGLTAGSVYYVDDGTTIASNATGGNDSTLSTANYKMGQSFTTGGSDTKIDWVMVRVKVSNATGVGNANCEIYATSGGLPTGAALGTSQSDDSSEYTTSYVTYTYRFITPVSVSSSTVYALVLTADAVGGANTISYERSGASVYAGGARLYWNTVIWAAQADDLVFYVGYNDGTISTNAGTVTKRIGLASSTTKLFILNS